MSNKPTTLPALLRADDAPERRERLYLFLVTGAAVFLVTLFASARPQFELPVQAVIERSSAGTEERPDDAKAQLTGDEQIRAALAAVESCEAAEVETAHVAHFRAELQVAAAPPLGQRGGQWTVSYHGGRPSGVEVVNALVKAHVDQHSGVADDTARAAFHAARRRLDEARRRSAEAQEVVHNFLAEYFDQLQSGAAAEVDPQSQLAASPEDRIRNPRWVQLREELDLLEQQKDQLLVKLHPQHPLARSSQLEIEALAQQLAATIETIPRGSGRSSGTRDDTRGRLSTIELDPYHEQRARYEKLLTMQRDTATAVAAAEAALERSKAKLQAADRGQLKVVHWAQAGETSRAAGLSTAAFALVLAVVCGGLAARSVPCDPSFRNRAHAERTLGVAVVGCIPDATIIRDPNRGRPPIGTRIIRRASELTLLAVLLFVIALLIHDARFAMRLATEPLSAMYAAGEQFQAWLR